MTKRRSQLKLRKEINKMKFVLFAIFVLQICSVTLAEDKKGKLWALLVAGSREWSNYRHQADVCHAYQVILTLYLLQFFCYRCTIHFTKNHLNKTGRNDQNQTSKSISFGRKSWMILPSKKRHD